MSYSLAEATSHPFFTLKLGDQGWQVLACQVALNSHYPSPNLTLDGIAGPRTIKAVEELQHALFIRVDGEAGPETQEAFTKIKCRHAEPHLTPAGLLAGICEMESSYEWACTSPTNDNGTRDYGVTQMSIPLPPSGPKLHTAFDPAAACQKLAAETAGAYKAFVGKVDNRRAWELAALWHNWPFAAERLADGEGDWLDKSFAFVEPTYKTGLEYVDHYIAVATGQVISWTV